MKYTTAGEFEDDIDFCHYKFINTAIKRLYFFNTLKALNNVFFYARYIGVCAAEVSIAFNKGIEARN